MNGAGPFGHEGDDQPVERATGVGFAAVSAAVAALWLGAGVVPGGWPAVRVVAVGLGVVVALTWLVLLVIHVVSRWAGERVGPWYGFLVPPLILIACLLLSAAEAPLRVGFAMSRGEMDRLADRGDAFRSTLDPGELEQADLDDKAVGEVRNDGRVGVYPVDSVTVEPDGTWIAVRSPPLLAGYAGFFRLADGAPEPRESDASWHLIELGDGWYAYSFPLGLD